ncbi:Uncharacterized conserved protein [Candidatus Ornithobacterium hominis]|uniref:Uncharacterized conserved protein n=1 Tax=Candidatus Ornithobacterium hominis TaxID=2497989 RepID=A0A383TV15_9FLAO|nr:sulfite exporter TauE/SafE family protein [Candidatus Ornithobacterium hominis]MCT7903727.1 sulfite exporter TauE/SafE family protein [Candidatus Ornithobacterium hominis]SZD71070.1 Uncharacterized conserved protein [Candidatus Ornithobacterium hominis]SZD71743.1 Uncharacterized conserved protein [Candidatus Ornithobacterium hominis]
MDTTLIIAAISLGLASSLHCVGMCGPIAFSLGLNQENAVKSLSKNLTYQTGRAITYLVLGLCIGVIGTGFTAAGIQSYISIFAGILMILMVFLPKNLEKHISPKFWLGKILIQLKSKLAQFLKRKSYLSFLVTGLLNGLLPCGAVYIALVAAIAAGSPLGSGLFMFLFGLGTMPLMFLAALAGSTIHQNFRLKIVKLLPYLTVLVGIIFILRGMSLGIPYLSPPQEVLNTKVESTHHCH